MLELYIDDEFIECWTMGCPEAQTVRFVPEQSGATLNAAHAFG